MMDGGLPDADHQMLQKSIFGKFFLINLFQKTVLCVDVFSSVIQHLSSFVIIVRFD